MRPRTRPASARAAGCQARGSQRNAWSNVSGARTDAATSPLSPSTSVAIPSGTADASSSPAIDAPPTPESIARHCHGGCCERASGKPIATTSHPREWKRSPCRRTLGSSGIAEKQISPMRRRRAAERGIIEASSKTSLPAAACRPRPIVAQYGRFAHHSSPERQVSVTSAPTASADAQPDAPAARWQVLQRAAGAPPENRQYHAASGLQPPRTAA